MTTGCRAQFSSLVVVGAAMMVASCGSKPMTPTPVPVTSAPPSGSQAVAYELTGVVIGDDGRLVANARVAVDFQPSPGAFFTWAPGVTDGAGRYSVKFSAAPAGYLLQSTAMVYVDGDGYEGEYGWLRPVTADPRQSLDLHPRLIRQISAGESVDVTVAPGDTFCLNNVQDFPGLGDSYVCRIVRIVAPADGVLTIEALSSETGGLGATLENEWVSGSGQTKIDAEMGTPRSLLVTAGTVIKASVEIPISSTTSQMFRFKTSITPQ